MNSAPINALLFEVARRYITLQVHDGRLRFQPKAAMCDALRAQIAEHKQELIALLAAAPVEIVPPCYSCRRRTHWRLPHGTMWVCAVCQPPLPALDKIEVVVLPMHDVIPVTTAPRSDSHPVDNRTLAADGGDHRA